MKRLILPLLLLTTSISIAQSRKGLTLVPKLSVMAAEATDGIYYHDTWNGFHLIAETGSSANIGADIGYMFNNKIGLFTGIGYSYTKLLYTDYGITMQQDQWGITQPLYFRFVSSKYGRVGFALNTGFNATYMFSATVSSGSLSEENLHEINSPQIEYFINPGINIPFGKMRGSLDVGLIASIQLNNNYIHPLNSNVFYGGLRIASPIRIGK